MGPKGRWFRLVVEEVVFVCPAVVGEEGVVGRCIAFGSLRVVAWWAGRVVIFSAVGRWGL